MYIMSKTWEFTVISQIETDICVRVKLENIWKYREIIKNDWKSTIRRKTKNMRLSFHP